MKKSNEKNCSLVTSSIRHFSPSEMVYSGCNVEQDSTFVWVTTRWFFVSCFAVMELNLIEMLCDPRIALQKLRTACNSIYSSLLFIMRNFVVGKYHLIGVLILLMEKYEQG